MAATLPMQLWNLCGTLLLSLAACSSPASETAAAPTETPKAAAKHAEAPAPATAKTSLTLSPDGLSVAETPSGKISLIKFGIPRASAELAVGNVQGAQLDKGSSAECGAGTIDFTSYRDGLQLTFQDGQFVGWTINSAGSPLRTAEDIGVGSTRQALDAAYPGLIVEDSSLGLLFSKGELVGLLDIEGIDGLVTDIWAGTVCLID